MSVNFDQLAESYRRYRKPDPRIAERIQVHLADGQRVLNVGAGIGAYEPDNCDVVAIEPSYEMIAQRKSADAVWIQGVAEDLPFRDNSLVYPIYRKDWIVFNAILSVEHGKKTCLLVRKREFGSRI